MKRAEFEHAIRAAAAVLGVRELLVIGSDVRVLCAGPAIRTRILRPDSATLP